VKLIKNILIGFLVSFIGSIPLGYLNVIGFEIYSISKLNSLIEYLVGVVIIEAIVIYGTLFFAEKLSLNQKLKNKISLFSIFFLLLLTYYFYTLQKNELAQYNLSILNVYPPFIIGIVLSSMNFAQIPFWLSWNLYLVNEKYISNELNLKKYYLVGTLFGTFFGMLALILGLSSISNTGVTNRNLLLENIWIIFLGLTIFQIIQFVRKK
jgi:hypothetical protein